jgi:hypothetical protein
VTGLPESFVVVGGLCDPVVDPVSSVRSSDEGPVEVLIDEEPPSEGVEVDVSLVDGGIEVVVGVVLISSIPPRPEVEVEIEFEVKVELTLVEVGVVEVSVLLVLSCVPLSDEEVVGGGVTEDDMLEIEVDELLGGDGVVSVTVGLLELDA